MTVREGKRRSFGENKRQKARSFALEISREQQHNLLLALFRLDFLQTKPLGSLEQEAGLREVAGARVLHVPPRAT